MSETNGAKSLNLVNCINIEDGFKGYNKEVVTIPKHYESAVSRVLIPHGLIQDRIEKIAYDIFYDMMNGGVDNLVMLCVLKGGYRFFADLQDKISFLNSNCNAPTAGVQMCMEFIRVKSYENTGSVSGDVKIQGIDDLKVSLKGKNVLIVEDIVDTGKTMRGLLKKLQEYEPKSVRVACLLRKKTHLSDCYVPDYVGFEVPDKFVIGYAFDYNEFFRDLKHVCVISPDAIEKYKR